MAGQPAQVVAAAGSAIVAGARVGRLLSRAGWRIARQFPGGQLVEMEAVRLQHAALSEARRVLAAPGLASGLPGAIQGIGHLITDSSQQQRAAQMIRTADAAQSPLRNAMSELLERSVEATQSDASEYLFGTIISQLVPDEARILAALSSGHLFAGVDVVLRRRRNRPHLLVGNVSSIGRQAGLGTPEKISIYLGRLLGYGLIERGPEDPALAAQYDTLSVDPIVTTALDTVEPRRRKRAKLHRTTFGLSAFGREFWTATDPQRPPAPSTPTAALPTQVTPTTDPSRSQASPAAR